MTVTELVRRLTTREEYERAGLLDDDVPADVRLDVCFEAGRTLGLTAAREILQPAGPHLAALLVGAGEACVELGLAYAKDRVVFGKPLAKNAVQRNLFATAAAELAAAHALARRALTSQDPLELDACVPIAAEAAWLAADTALQVHGGYGYTDEYEISRRWTEIAGYR